MFTRPIPPWVVHSEVSIQGFYGDYYFLSNFYPCKVYFKNLIYPSSENAYQAAKWPENEREQFLNISAAQAKQLGNKANLNPRWHELKFELMCLLVFDKFLRNRDIRDALIKTGNKYIEETNDFKDTYWGVCNGVGENNLGKILMKVREFWK